MSESGDSSSRGSMSSGGASSVASDNSDARALGALQDKEGGGDESINDLLEQNKGLQETAFAGLYTLTKNRQCTSYRMTAFRIVLEFLQIFRVVFNTNFTAWHINRDLWIWKGMYWVLFRFLVWETSYDVYISVFYLLAAIILGSVVVTLWVAWLLKKDENGSTWIKRVVSTVQLVAFVVYSLFWVAVLDYVVFLFACDWSNIRAPMHVHWTTHNCLAMPHMAHMFFALFVAAVFCTVTLCLSISDCDSNPLTRNYLSSPVPIASFKILALKMVMVIVSTVLDTVPQAQPIVMIICTAAITYYIITSVQFYWDYINHIWVGLWFGMLYTTTLLVVSTFSTDRSVEHRSEMTMAVLYGIFPAVLLGAGVSVLNLKWVRRPIPTLQKAFKDPSYINRLKEVYRFSDVEQVEVLSRAMRVWDRDGMPDQAAAEFGEFIIKCGMARFPNNPYMLIMYANFMLEARKDGQAARTQLQLATKNNPSLVERYAIYVCSELAKRLKTDSDGLDLLGYVEFQRNYRACVKAHKLALQAQRHFWHTVLRDTVPFADLQRCFEVLDTAEKQATQVYRRVMERYPNNGRLLKIYGRFVEYVRNDPWNANRYYSEASKQGTSESLLSLTGGKDGDNTKLASILGPIDEKVDGVIIINAAGIIMMVSPAASRMWGYEKGELEGKNVSVLMPQPFSVKHNSFLQHYTSTGEARILDSHRHVVALNKERSVFPVSLVVTKLSGTGSEAIFMGVVKAAVSDDPTLVKLWATTTGIVLCADARFVDWFGMTTNDLIGKKINSLATDLDVVEKFVMDCTSLPEDQVDHGRLTLRTKMLHKFLAPIEVELGVEFGGTVDQRILVFNVRCLADPMALMVVDHKGRIAHATSQLGTLLGYPLATLQGMTLSQIVPPPYAQLHTGWMKDLSAKPGPGSCRAGGVVHLLNANNQKVPVTLHISQRDNGDHVHHVVQVTKCTLADPADLKRISLTVNRQGRVLSIISAAGRSLFGFQPNDLVGQRLGNFVNVFATWRVKHGDEGSLLLLLSMRAEEHTEEAWRVGVHLPVTDEEVEDKMTEADKAKEADHSFTAMHSRHRERPAMMTVQQALTGEDEDVDLSSDNTPVLRIHLWRADAVSTVLEVDSKLHITKAEPLSGVMFGVSHKMLQRKTLTSLLMLPSGTNSSRLLSSGALDTHQGKGAAAKGAMKGSNVHKIGPLRTTEARHVDGQMLKLQFQPVSKEAGASSGSAKLLVTLAVTESTTGTIAPFLAMRTATNSGGGAAGGDQGHAQLGAAEVESSDSEGGDHGSDGATNRPASPTDLHSKLDSRLRVAEWVKTNSFDKRDAPEGAALKHRGAGGHAMVEVSVKGRGKDGAPPMKEGEEGRAMKMGLMDMDDRQSVGSGSQASGAGPGGSEADASSAAGSDDDGGEEELVSDWRRAKRLKKLNRVMTCSAAQTASERFKKHTLLLVLTITLAHVLCFVILVTQVNARYQNSYEVESMATAADKGQLLVLRNLLMQYCMIPMFEVMDTCSDASFANYHHLMRSNADIFRAHHQSLYLGSSGIEGFADQRLKAYWTSGKLPEVNYFEPVPDYPQGYTAQDNRSLWEIGNRYLSAADEVYFWSGKKSDGKLADDLQLTRAYQYILQNGPTSLFQGYAWSLDVMVEYTWLQLGSLSTLLIILLIVEAIMVQMICIMYEFVLLKMCNLQHMKRFSVFLALPSATIRSMTARPCVVDDDDKSDVDDEEMEAVNAELAGDAARQGAAADQEKEKAPTVKKGVRIQGSTGGAEDDEEEGGPKKASKGGKAKSSKKTAAELKEAAKRAKHASWSYRMRKKLFGWATMNYKINGKRLVPNNHIVWRFMLPIALWCSAVIIIFGVSFQELSDLQGPLASLNVAAHVMYRVARLRAQLSLLAFELNTTVTETYRAEALTELGLLRREYETLLYGGRVLTLAEVSFDFIAPAGAFASAEFAHLFFKTTDCLRFDQSTCFTKDSKYHDVTHHGLDAIMSRYMDDVQAFAKLPPSLTWPNHTLYIDATYLAPADMYDGLQTASHMFVQHTISRFERVKMLHIVLLVVTLVLMLCFLTMLFRPYHARLHVESKTIAGLLSQLPPEVDVEALVKSSVLGMNKDGAAGKGPAPGMLPGMMPGMPGMMPGMPGMVPGAMMQPGMMPGATKGRFGLGWGGAGGAQGQMTQQQMMMMMQQQQQHAAIGMGGRQARGWGAAEEQAEEEEEQDDRRRGGDDASEAMSDM